MNRKLILQNDSLLSVNHQLLNEASCGKEKGGDVLVRTGNEF
jgi:hypothetical protein